MNQKNNAQVLVNAPIQRRQEASSEAAVKAPANLAVISDISKQQIQLNHASIAEEIEVFNIEMMKS